MYLKIEKVNYSNKKESRILESVLENWFKNPKDLCFIDPTMKYPFKFKKWAKLIDNIDKRNDIKTFCIKENNWMIGMGNILIDENSETAQIMHIFVDEKYRRNGVAMKMVEYLEKLAKSQNISTIDLLIMPKNDPAKNLFKKIGFKEMKIEGRKTMDTMKFRKELH